MESNLFNIQAKYLAIINEIENAEGEITPELDNALSINDEDKDNKFLAYIHIIKQKEADIKLAKDEIKRIQEFVKRNDNTIKKLKDRLMQAMRIFELFGKKGNLSYKVGSHSMFSRSTVAVEVEELTYGKSLEIPEYVNYNINAKLNKQQLDKVLKALDGSIEPDTDINVTPNKTLIKEGLITIGREYENVEEDAAPIEMKPIERYADLINNESLTIR